MSKCERCGVELSIERPPIEAKTDRNHDDARCADRLASRLAALEAKLAKAREAPRSIAESYEPSATVAGAIAARALSALDAAGGEVGK